MPFTVRSYLRFPILLCSVTLLVLGTDSLPPTAYAEWLEIATSDSRGETYYVDPQTTRQKENMVRIWGLTDYKTAQTLGRISFLSMKTQTEYDCKGKRGRVLASVAYSGNMGGGTMLGKDTAEDEWMPVLPQTFGQGIWEFACQR